MIRHKFCMGQLMCRRSILLQTPALRYFSAKTSHEVNQHFTSLCSKRRLKQAFETFRFDIWRDPPLFSHLLKACLPGKSISVNKQLHALILTSGCSRDKFILNHLLNVYVKLGYLEEALSLFDTMPRRNVMSCNILINGFVQAGDLDGAIRLFDDMTERNVATWNAMVTGLVQLERNDEGLNFFEQMHELGFLPDEYTLGSVLRGCAGLRVSLVGQQVHAYVMKNGFDESLVVGSSLANMYMKCGRLEDGEKVIRAMPMHNVVAWNTLIAGTAQNGFSDEVLDQYNIMKISGFRPDRITFVSVISACSELATIGQGQQIHAEAIKCGVDSVVAVLSSLISMYSRCGCLDDSVKAFVECEDKDIVLWSAMLAAYGFHGRGQEAVELFERMEKEGVEANDVTFLSLLYACSHCGLKEKGREFFKLMIENYGVKPSVQHYTCLVDLLGRFGSLKEAEDTIRSMPVKADTIIWKTLLSACKIHKNEDMARRIGEEILKLDPRDSAPYVLLSNIHASAKRWQDVSNVRKTMRDNMVKKEPGISWFEVKNQIHQFCTGDKSHPHSNEIELYLKELYAEMKLRGYVPDMGAVLHDMDNEEKEYNLSHHSEKLAIAYALMTTSPGAPIRIMKNLRVCSDCHVAFKFISEIKGREIVVRDASRFHHFKNGKCSCGDYW